MQKNPALTKGKALHWLSLSIVLALAVALLYLFLRTELSMTKGELGVPLDDAWIHYQFARNLSQGDGFSYNPGEPAPGSTAPLWTLLLAGVGLFTEDFLLPSLLLSAFFFLLTIGLTYGLTYFLTADWLAAFLAALGVAFTGRLLWAGLAGMETTAFAALSVAGVWAYSRQGLRPFPALLLGLAGQLRPEGHALFALAAADSLWTALVVDRHSVAKAGKSLLIPGLIYGAIAAPYAIFSLVTTGHPLPNTFYAKVGSEHFFSWRTLRETMRLHWLDNPVSLALVPVGLIPAWKRGRLVVVWLLALPLFTAVIVDFIWHHGRYTMPLIPFQMIAAAVGVNWMLEKIAANRQSARTVAAVLAILFFSAGGLWRGPHWAEMLGNNAREILEIDVALGQWLAENTPPDALIAVDDIGAIAYLSQRRIVDMNGLVSPEMWPALRQPAGLPRNQAAARILSALSPDYLVGFPLWHWEIATNTAVSYPIHRVQTDTRTIIAEQEAVVYRTNWPYLTGAVKPQIASRAVWGEVIQLLGYDISPINLAEPLWFILYWHSLATVPDSYDIFIHLVNSSGEIVAQTDQKPVQGLATTDVWHPGDTVRDPYQLIVPPDLPVDSYALNVGLYLRETGERLPIVVGGQPIDDALTLTTIDWSGN